MQIQYIYMYYIILCILNNTQYRHARIIEIIMCFMVIYNCKNKHKALPLSHPIKTYVSVYIVCTNIL